MLVRKKSRVSKGQGIISILMEFLLDFFFEIAMILRSSLMISSVLFNSEAWYNVSKAKSNPKEML